MEDDFRELGRDTDTSPEVFPQGLLHFPRLMSSEASQPQETPQISTAPILPREFVEYFAAVEAPTVRGWGTNSFADFRFRSLSLCLELATKLQRAADQRHPSP